MAFTSGLASLLYGAVRAATALDALVACELSTQTSSAAPLDSVGTFPLSKTVGECTLPMGWPGGWATFPWELSCFVAQVFTVWLAFALLPFSTGVPACYARPPRMTTCCLHKLTYRDFNPTPLAGR